MTNNQIKAAALHASTALCHIDALLALEKPGSARWNRCRSAIDSINRAVDLYRLEAFQGDDMRKAVILLDLVNAEIVRMYPIT